ncbi:MAG: hypothetical protein ABDH59_05820 [Fervidobacterium sp.]
MSNILSIIQDHLGLFEAYLRKQFVEKIRTIIFFIVLMLFPDKNVKMFCLFFIMLFSIISDIRHNRIELMIFLPFTRKMVYWYEFGFMTLLVLLTTFAGLPFYRDFSSALADLLSSMIYLSGYYGAIISLTMLRIDGIAAAFLFLVIDSILSSWDSYTNVFRLISPSSQGNTVSSLIFSLGLLLIGYLTFEKGGRK